MKSEYESALKEILNIGLGKAANTISELLESQVDFSIPETKRVTQEELSKLLAIEYTNLNTTVDLKFHGVFNGNVVLALNDMSTINLVELLTGEDSASPEFDEMIPDTLQEVGNIVLNSLMGSISNVFNKELSFEVPSYKKDCLTEVLAADNNFYHTENIFITTTNFSTNHLTIAGEIFFLFELSSFDNVLKSVSVTDLTRHLYGYRVMRDKALEEIQIRQEAERKLEIANQELQAFNTRVAHDLRSPLAFMVSMTDFMYQAIDNLDEMKKQAELIHRSATKGLEIVQGLYQLSNLNDTISMDTLDINEITKSETEILSQLIEYSKAEIICNCSHLIRGNRDIFPQVLQNLISNSIKFTQDIRQPKISITTRRENDDVIIYFEDNGQGIPKEHRDRVFNAFERNHGHEVEGLGLGLSMIKKIIELHNGSIEITDSKTLGGACFKISFKQRKSPRYDIFPFLDIIIYEENEPENKLPFKLRNRSKEGVGGSIPPNFKINLTGHYIINDRNILKPARICWVNRSDSLDEIFLGFEFLKLK